MISDEDGTHVKALGKASSMKDHTIPKSLPYLVGVDTGDVTPTRSFDRNS